MLLDHKLSQVDTFALWSGDSDFANPLEQLLDDNKKALLFATARKVSTELNKLGKKGLFIYDIQKIRNFICWNKELEEDSKTIINAKGIPTSGSPKL
ncbi:NYN domain-containing protein [Candidatus Falkowbacteria bacterium]|nr:NYN domain-containing protein [Candidatus Falkowbacteria bacterium]